jgi:hypothetical protein
MDVKQVALQEDGDMKKVVFPPDAMYVVLE